MAFIIFVFVSVFALLLPVPVPPHPRTTTYAVSERVRISIASPRDRSLAISAGPNCPTTFLLLSRRAPPHLYTLNGSAEGHASALVTFEFVPLVTTRI